MKKINLLFKVLIVSQIGFSQISIVSTSVNSLNVYPKSMCQATIFNSTPDKIEIILESKINDGNSTLIKVKSNTIVLQSGINYISETNLSLREISYGNDPKSLELKNSGALPIGIYKHCTSIESLNKLESGDILCETIESEALLNITLIYPADKDTILTTNPNLVWHHNESFASTGPTESYRILLVEPKEDQNIESAINTQRPVFIKDFLNNHLVPYPMDAYKLEPGKRYGWQVQKVVNGRVSAKSETWEFIIKPEDTIKYNKYAVVGRSGSSGFYYANGNKLFFKFEEEYMSSGSLNYIIMDEKRKIIPLSTKNERNENSTLTLKNNLDNRFEIDLNSYNLKTGFYLLEIRNEKNELFHLKFYIGS